MHESARRATPPRIRRLITAAFDGASWAGALTASSWLRHEFDFTQINFAELSGLVVAAVAAVWLAGAGTRLYFGRYSPGSLDEALGLARVMTLTGATIFTIVLLGATPAIPRSVPLIATLLALATSAAARIVVRGYGERRARPDHLSAKRVLIYGAGDRGQALVRSVLSGNAGHYIPIALLDDDPALRHATVSGVAVRGTGMDLATLAHRTGAELLIVAISNPSPATMRLVVAAAKENALEVKILPPLDELLRPWVRFSDLRDLDVTDLLGRKPVNTDVASIAGCLTGRTVLVTGAGGSIGTELCRQLHRFGPAELIMLDRDESALHAVQLSIHSRSQLDSPNLVLADIRDTETIRALLAARRPDVVFHAAALKHLPLLERYPEEAWKTNVLGTMDLLDAAIAADVRTFVNISTDKAANPGSVLGRSKRIGERLVADAAMKTSGTYLSVRFGNVLGSRGSVLTTFTEQLSAGMPLTITHPDVTRFFMTIPEAVQLVIQAAAIGDSGEALVLDMGRPESIVDLAETLMTITGRRSEVVFTGLCRGEKLHEELFGTGEEDHRPKHPAISHVTVPRLKAAEVRARADKVGCARALVDLTDEHQAYAIAGTHLAADSAKAGELR